MQCVLILCNTDNKPHDLYFVKHSSGSDNNSTDDERDDNDRNCTVVAHDSHAAQRRSTTAPDRDIQIAHDDDDDVSAGAVGNGNSSDDHDDSEHDHRRTSSTARAPIDRVRAIIAQQQHRPSSSSLAIGGEVDGGGNSARYDNKHTDDIASNEAAVEAEHDRDADNDNNCSGTRAIGSSREPPSNSAAAIVNANVLVTAQSAHVVLASQSLTHPVSRPEDAAAAAAAAAPVARSASAPTTAARPATICVHADDGHVDQQRSPPKSNGRSTSMYDTPPPAATTAHNMPPPQQRQQLPLGTDAIRPDKPPKPAKSGGFLSRFTGFRFSLRGSGGSNSSGGKKKSAAAASAAAASTDNNNAKKRGATGAQSPNVTGKSPDYIYIPLKEPVSVSSSSPRPDYRTSADSADKSTLSVATPSASSSVTGSLQSSPNASMVFRAGDLQQTSTPQSAAGRPYVLHGSGGGGGEQRHVVVTTKPPLPKQPPRIVGVSAKQTTPPHQQQQSSSSTLSQHSPHAQLHRQHHPNSAHARAASVPREINDYDSDYESSSVATPTRSHHGDGSGYDANRHQHQQQQYSANNTASSGSQFDDADSSYDSSVSNYYQRKRYGQHRGHLMSSAGHGVDDVDEAAAGRQRPLRHDSRIGLIETNLDTHETVISGKTRSLMELGPLGPSGAGAAGRMVPNNCQRTASSAVQRGDGSNGGSGASMEPTRRPHKSMEFLLDKENQRNVLVSDIMCLRGCRK